MNVKSHTLPILTILLIAFFFAVPGGNIRAQAKYSLYVARLSPHNNVTADFGEPKWGFGLAAVVPITQASIFPAFNIGLEYFKCYGESNEYWDPDYGPYDIRTSQTIYRFYTGGRAVLSGSKIIHPFIGGDITLMICPMHTDYVTVVPSYPYENWRPSTELSEILEGQIKTPFGYDLNAGCEFQLADTFILEGGMRYLHSFNAPVHFDDYRAVTIASDYFQIYFAAGKFFHTHRNN